MYYYLIDSRSYPGKNFEYYQSQLLSLLTEYQINGEIARVTRLRPIVDLVNTAFTYGTKTLIVVGNDETFTEVLNICRGKKITLGYIPLSGKSELGRILGIQDLGSAVEVIAKRRTEDLDLAVINGSYFVSNLYFGLWKKGKYVNQPESFSELWALQPQNVEIVFDKLFRAKDKFLAGCIINARFHECNTSDFSVLGNPRDGRLDVILVSTLSKFQLWKHRKKMFNKCYESLPGSSVMHASYIEVTSPQGMPLYLSGKFIANTPAVISMTKEKIKIIVGKTRQF